MCGADGCYSTAEICRAVFGGLNEERLLTQRELTRKYQLDNAIVEASVLNRAELAKGFSAVADALNSIIATSDLTREQKEHLQRELASIPLVCDNVAKAQTRLHRSNNNNDGETLDGGARSAKKKNVRSKMPKRRAKAQASEEVAS